VKLYRSLDATVAQLKNCPFGVNAAVELKNLHPTLPAQLVVET